MIFGELLWHRSDYYLYEDKGKFDGFILYICGDLPITGTLDEIRDYLKEQLGEDYFEVCKDFWRDV